LTPSYKDVVAGSASVRPVVCMERVRFAWPGRHAFAFEIDAFSLSASERVLLIGPSGSGKSTFLSLLCGILTPQTGRIEVLGTDFTALSGTARDQFRADHFGIIFQMFNLLPYGSAVDNIILPLAFACLRRQRVTRDGDAQATALRLMQRLGLDEKLAHQAAAKLSVGQQQRVAAARSLIGTPEIVVADEPTSSLDRDRQAAFLDMLFEQVAEAGTTLIMVSHDESLAPRFDRVVRLDEIAREVQS
jgi:putative ABC transport system ATP-binding protein